LGVQLREVKLRGDRIHLTCARKGDGESTLIVDHVIAATGYRVALQRLRFLDERLLHDLRSVADTPVLNTNFESSVPGLHIVGLASANCFGPLARFAFGARFTARRLSRSLG
jgi:hypothetical protein